MQLHVVAKAKILKNAPNAGCDPIKQFGSHRKRREEDDFSNNEQFKVFIPTLLYSGSSCLLLLYSFSVYVCIHSIQKNVVSTQQGYSEFGSFKTRHDASLENALFRIEKFMLDEMFQCFKIAHTLAYKN